MSRKPGSGGGGRAVAEGRSTGEGRERKEGLREGATRAVDRGGLRGDGPCCWRDRSWRTNPTKKGPRGVGGFERGFQWEPLVGEGAGRARAAEGGTGGARPRDVEGKGPTTARARGARRARRSRRGAASRPRSWAHRSSNSAASEPCVAPSSSLPGRRSSQGLHMGRASGCVPRCWRDGKDGATGAADRGRHCSSRSRSIALALLRLPARRAPCTKAGLDARSPYLLPHLALSAYRTSTLQSPDGSPWSPRSSGARAGGAARG